MHRDLTTIAQTLVKEFAKEEQKGDSEVVSVNPIVADLATWYEKLRNAMEYQDEEVVIRSAVERILKRRLIFGGSGKTVAEPLARELLWAKYLGDTSMPEEKVDEVAERIDLYIQLEKEIVTKHKTGELRKFLSSDGKDQIHEWLTQVLSADLTMILKPTPQEELIAKFMFHILRKKIVIKDETEEEKDVQTFIAVRRAFLKDDKAFLRYNLFVQYFGSLDKKNIGKISDEFLTGYKVIEKNWSDPLKDRIFSYVKKQTPPFLILKQVLFKYKENLNRLFEIEDEFDKAVSQTCTVHYISISEKVQRALFRSIVFLFITKVLIAIVVEGSYERLVYGQIALLPMMVNIFVPPLMMASSIFFIKTPGKENSQQILRYIKSYLTDPEVGVIKIKRFDKKSGSIGVLYAIFLTVWLLSTGVIILGVVTLLTKLHMNIVSQGIFLFFMVTASFLAYRINQTAQMYKVYEERGDIRGALFDFIFMPFIYLGRRFTEGVSKINVLIVVFDFLIEMPLKSIFNFIEEWFVFLRHQKEKLD